MNEIESNVFDTVQMIASDFGHGTLNTDFELRIAGRIQALIDSKTSRNNIAATIEATEQPTLRDQFAMQALNALIPECKDAADYDGLPAAIYRLADAMMDARK